MIEKVILNVKKKPILSKKEADKIIEGYLPVDKDMLQASEYLTDNYRSIQRILHQTVP